MSRKVNLIGAWANAYVGERYLDPIFRLSAIILMIVKHTIVIEPPLSGNEAAFASFCLRPCFPYCDPCVI